MLLDKSGIHLRHIAQKVSSCIERIFSDASCLSLETREFVGYFCKAHVCFRWDLLDHHYRLETDSLSVFLVFRHFASDEFDVYIQNIAECGSVKLLDLPWGYKQVVCDLVADKDVAVPVVYDTSCRIDGRIYHRVILGVKLVLVVENLNAEKFDKKNRCDYAEACEQLVFPVEFHRASYFLSSGVSVLMTISDTR